MTSKYCFGQVMLFCVSFLIRALVPDGDCRWQVCIWLGRPTVEVDNCNRISGPLDLCQRKPGPRRANGVLRYVGGVDCPVFRRLDRIDQYRSL